MGAPINFCTDVIEAACTRAGLDQLDRLRPLKDALPPEVTYDEIRLVVARLRREQSQAKTGTTS